MAKENIINQLQEFKAQAQGMLNWADKMLTEYESPKKKALSEHEINRILNRRRKVKSKP